VDKKNRSRVRSVAVFTVFLAVAATIFQFTKSNRGHVKPSDFKESKEKFEDNRGSYMNSAALSLSTTDMNKAKTALRSLRRYHIGDLVPTSEKANGISYIYTFKLSDYDQIVKIINEDKAMQLVDSNSKPGNVPADEEELKLRLEGYKRQRIALLQKENPTTDIHEQVAKLNGEIEKTTADINKLKSMDQILVLITTTQQQKSQSPLSIVRTVGLDFLRNLGFLFVGVVIVYYGTKLLMYLLSIMGIKGLGMSGINYGGSYNYGGFKNYAERYNYGYGRRRKTKRVYKEKEQENEPKE